MKHQTPSESPQGFGGSWRPRSGHLPPPPEHRGVIDDDSDDEVDDVDVDDVWQATVKL